MKNALIIVIALTATILAGYFGYFFITPNVAVVNASSGDVSSFVVTLPNSRLDFGALKSGETNTIYYSIAQSDGSYSTMVITKDGRKLNKTCGTVTENEIHKRVTITFTETQGLACAGT